MISLPSKHLVITVAIIIASFFLLLWANERYNSYISSRDSEAERDWKAAVERAAKTHERIKASIVRDSAATRVIEAARSVARTAIAEANRIRSIRESMPVPVLTDSTSPQWQRLYRYAVVENDSLRSVIKADSLALGTALWARDSLRAVLLTADSSLVNLPKTGQKLIDVRTCKVLWLISCPSRRVVAVTSGLVGLAAGVYIERQRSKQDERRVEDPVLAMPIRGY